MKTKISIVTVASTLAVIIIYILATTRFDSKQGFLENNWDLIFWMLAGIGALALLVFGLKSRTSTPTTGSTPDKKPFPKWLKWCLWIGGIALAAFLLSTYTGQDITKQTIFSMEKIRTNAISYTVNPEDIKSLRETEIAVPGLNIGDYYVEVFSRKNVFNVKCPWEVGQRRRLFVREEGIMTDPELGNVLLRGKESPRKDAISSGGLIRIEESKKVIISFKELPPEEIANCEFASGTPIQILFKEDRE